MLRTLRSLSRLLCLSALPLFLALPALADEVRLLETDREAAEARVRLVLTAREEILASAFIFGDDPFTLTSLSLLRDARRRGLRVQLIVDAQWNKIPRAVQAHLLAEGVGIREYHPFRWDRLHWVTRRMHDKMVVADGRELVAGGRNVESTYFGFGRQVKRRNYVDLDVQVEGEVAAEARDYFLGLWESREVRGVRARASAEEMAEAARLLDQHKTWLDARVEEARRQGDEPSPAVEVEAGRVRFLHDPVGKKGRARGTAQGLRELLDGARESVLIESPYLVPSRRFRATLRRALARGVRFRILTNSLATTDNLWPQAGYVGHRKGLVRAGVELWEYTGPECVHSKAAVIDGGTVVVGSYNLDPRSERLNTELAVVVEDNAVAEALRQTLDAHLARSTRIDARGWPEGADRPFPGVPRGKVFKLRLLRLLAPFIKKQL